MPNQRMRSGMNAEIGMYLSGAITGSKIRLIGSNAPIRTPRGSATAEARRKASVIRRVETRIAEPRSYCMKSCSVPRTTSVGDGRKSGGARPPYVATHHAIRTAPGATKPSHSATVFGSGARSANGTAFLGPPASFFPSRELSAVIRRPSFAGEDDLDVRPAVELPSGLRGVVGDGVRLAAPDRLEPGRLDVREGLDDVFLHGERAPLGE